jgi:transposase
MKTGTDRKYTEEFRAAAVKQVIDGKRSTPSVARGLEMSDKTLANWVAKARKGQPLLKRVPSQPVSELQAENARLRQENARLRLEKEILKNAPHGTPRPFWIETSRR